MGESLWQRLRDWLSGPPRGAPMQEVPRGRVRLRGRRVRVRRFRLDLRPVTNAEYAAFVAATGRRRPQWMYRRGFDEPEQPVVGVTMFEAIAYARWAHKRLPTEAEWLRAARGDDDRPYPWGDVPPDPSRAHFAQGSHGAPAPVIAEPELPVRQAGAAPFGHVELVGNVWEWCTGAVLRGGFWGSADPTLDVRLEERPDRVTAGIGFRCAR